MLAERYKDDKKSMLDLSDSQSAAIDSLAQNIAKGKYTYETPNCPTCNKANFEVLAEKDRYGIPCRNVICKSCGIVMINPRLDGPSYAQFYANEYRDIYVWDYLVQQNFEDYFMTRYKSGEKIYQWLETNKAISKQQKSVLDIGCGSGGVLKYFSNQGHQTKGIDLGAEYLAYGRDQKGLDLSVSTIFDLEIPEPADLIIYSHVFEHILDLNKELGRINDLLSDDGFLFIAVPGVKWLKGNYLGDFMYYTQNAHTFSYSLTTLKNILQQNGFEMLQGNEEVWALFRKNATGTKQPIQNDFASINAYLKHLEIFRKFYKIKTKIGWTINSIFGR